MTRQTRIVGFDLARAYAIFGMYIVNFNMVFGNYHDASLMAQFLSLFSGNSSTVFVMLAGMGITLLVNNYTHTKEGKQTIRLILIKRALFLFILGMILSTWWPADILHFYAVYILIATLFLFNNKRVYIYVSILVTTLFYVLLLLIPYETSWDFNTLSYADFWTIQGFIRNTFYNGWNSVFPWLSYFFVGMYLGKIDWSNPIMLRKTFWIGFALYLTVIIVQASSVFLPKDSMLYFFLTSDYLPPMLPFIASTTGFGLILIPSFIFISNRFPENKIIKQVAKTGQFTLTHYILHLTLGIIIFEILTGRNATDWGHTTTIVEPAFILLYSICFFVASYLFTKLWLSKYKTGPLELLMRKFSD
ncbi:MAG: DUF418 domain-containing protein [Flammeovirgaceae bacterium]|jgi:uncharacterized protein|nr:DUF418 domain-containing protein [Flammeovirgaceae bacterium]